MEIENEDNIIMEECTNNSSFIFNKNFSKYPFKRTYNSMISNSNDMNLIKRIENIKLEKIYKAQSKDFFINNRKINLESYDIGGTQGNKTIIFKPREYNEDKEKKMVENYYKIKNSELNKAIFGPFQNYG